jgi:hypothetical protein
VLAALIGLNAAGILKFGSQQPPAALQAQTKGKESILKAQGQTAPPALSRNDTRETVSMPPEIYDWLEHLRQTELRRKEISNQQVSQMLVTMAKLQVSGGVDALRGLLDQAADTEADPPPPTEGIRVDSEQMRSDWNSVIQFFESKPAPAECVPIRDQYSRALYETSGMILDIVGAIDRASSDPTQAVASLNAMKGKSTQSIDQPAGETDRLVQEICDRYKTRKWFSIERDFGASGLFGR